MIASHFDNRLHHWLQTISGSGARKSLMPQRKNQMLQMLHAFLSKTHVKINKLTTQPAVGRERERQFILFSSISILKVVEHLEPVELDKEKRLCAKVMSSKVELREVVDPSGASGASGGAMARWRYE